MMIRFSRLYVYVFFALVRGACASISAGHSHSHPHSHDHSATTVVIDHDGAASDVADSDVSAPSQMLRSQSAGGAGDDGLGDSVGAKVY